MTKVQVKNNDTVPVDAKLARGLSDARSVKVHVGKEDTETLNATITNESEGEIAIPFGNLSKRPGQYRMEVEITYSDDSNLTIPVDGYDWVEITDDLA